MSLKIILIASLVLLSACGKKEAPDDVQAPDIRTPPTPRSVVDPAPIAKSVAVSPEGTLVLETLDQRASYGIGYRIARDILEEPNIRVDKAAILAGLKDGLEGRGQLTESELIAAAKGLVARSRVKVQEVNKEQADTSIAFLRENARRKGVATTSSGLQYEILRRPADLGGPRPSKADIVEIHYHGTLLDGTVFDSSIERGEPITVAVAGVIPAWREALSLMSVGDKLRLYVPPMLGYGREGAGRVPPYAVLKFDLELIGLDKR